MSFRVQISATALKQLGKFDRQVARRILDYLDDLTTLADVRPRGRGLAGDRAGLWRYRVGDCRVICDVRDSELVVIALEVAHRSVAYE